MFHQAILCRCFAPLIVAQAQSGEITEAGFLQNLGNDDRAIMSRKQSFISIRFTASLSKFRLNSMRFVMIILASDCGASNWILLKTTEPE
jgi:hypothetical protein